MNGNGSFNPQILVDKLAKLNSSQQSIETLSHWCIFHRKKARQVVETWDRQFHHSPREQRISFLYLANDILQNSRRKGSEFVAEFWKVLPDALHDVIEKGDDFGRKAALRLVDIWEDRKVFGSRGQVLKEELLGRNSENRNSSGKKTGNEFKHPAGEILEKILSSYDLVYDGTMDEDALFGRCRAAISSIEKIEKEIGNDFSLGNTIGSGTIEELKGWYNILRECVEQLKVAESSRMDLQSHLKEALHEQELKTELIHNQLQVVLSRYEQASNMLQQLPTKDHPVPPLPDPKPDEPSAPSSDVRPIFPVETHIIPGENKQEPTPVRYTQQQPPPRPPAISSPHAEEHRKNAAAEVAAKLAASTSSAQMLSYVLSSLASEGTMGGQSAKEDYPSDGKKPKVEDGVPHYVPPPPPPFPHPDSVNPPPPPPPPAMPLMPPMMPSGTQFISPAGPMMGLPYNYGSSPLQIPSSLPPFPMVGIPHYPLPSTTFHGFQTSEGIVGSFVQPPPLPATPPPLSRQ